MAVDETKVAEDWRERGYSCRMWTAFPGQAWNDYAYDVDTLIMLLDGDVEIEVEGQRITPEPGAEIPVPAGARHSVRANGADMARLFFGRRKS